MIISIINIIAAYQQSCRRHPQDVVGGDDHMMKILTAGHGEADFNCNDHYDDDDDDDDNLNGWSR